MTSTYEQDFYQWTQEQAQLLRSGALLQLDVENLIEEIESMGKSQKRALISRMTVLLMHLLKWDYQPDRRSGRWKSTIITQRKEIKRILKDNPGLKSIITEMLDETYLDAVEIASAETELPESTFPGTCPYTVEHLMGE